MGQESGGYSASNLGSGSPTAGNNYLLPAFAAVFLGATQLKNGRFNAWGTIIAVLLLGTGTTGPASQDSPHHSRNEIPQRIMELSLAESLRNMVHADSDIRHRRALGG